MGNGGKRWRMVVGNDGEQWGNGGEGRWIRRYEKEGEIKKLRVSVRCADVDGEFGSTTPFSLNARKREVDKELKFKEKFREFCLEVADTMKDNAEVIKELERFPQLCDNLEVVETVRMLRRVQ
ncbi:hypothetical protein Tco_0180791 [Tanacetum coccineum]